MSISIEHLAELLSGIARAQQAIIDAVDRANPGWRNTHLTPLLNVAANMRQAEPRLIDLPARILLRYQGRAAVDTAAIIADLERLFAQPVGGAAADPAAAMAPAPLAPGVARAAARRAQPAAAPAAAPAAPGATPPASSA
jgi:hypothetical protein